MRLLLAFLAVLIGLFLIHPGRFDRLVSDAPRSIEVWHGFNQEETVVFREIVNEFEQHWLETRGEPLRVRLTYVAFGDMPTKLRTAALGDLTPDVAFVDAIKVTDLTYGRALARIDELPTFQQRYENVADARTHFVGASFDSGIVNRLGETGLYALPVQTTTVALFWNRDLFRRNADRLRRAGLDPNRAPRDWDEALLYAEQLTSADGNLAGLGLPGSLWFNFTFFNMYGVEFISIDESGKAQSVINSPRAKAALDRIQANIASGFESGAWRTGGLGPEAGFINQRYAMILTGPWMVENFTNAGLDFDIALIPAPPQREIDALGLPPQNPDLVDTHGILAWSSSNVGGQSGVIMRTAVDVEASYEFLEYFTSERVQRHWASTLGQIPVRLSAWEDLDTSRFPFMTRFMDQLQVARRIPGIPLFETLETNVFNPEINLLLNNRQDADQMLRNMDNSLNARIISRMNEVARDAGP